MTWIAIAGGGAVGAVARYGLANSIYTMLGRGFPYGTLVVNLVGSLLMGFLFVFLLERINVGPEIRAAIIVGFLGSFTTFSTFSMETLTLINQGAYTKAALNIILSVVLCILFTALGVALARRL
ncbi:MAG: fluoride efflux transporter CrcB [Gammaproteobacteria bacterium]|nr:fluoride efflux transporter CrcB [Gammaproteobacteria bacterium]